MELSEFKDRLAAGSLTRRGINQVLASVGLVTVSMPVIKGPARAAPTIQVFTWSGYDVPDLHGAFTETYGASPEFVFFADNDEAIEKVRAGYTPTLAQPTSFMLGRWRDAGLLSPIDTSRLSHYPQVFQQLKELDAMTQEGQVYGVPLVWGISSVLFRKDLAPEYVDNHTWEILWDPKYAGRLAQRDSMDATVLQAALLLGVPDPYNMSDADLERVREKLVEQRDLLRYYWTSQTDIEQAIASGELVAAYAWNDAYAALRREGIDVGYMAPKEGIIAWVDTTCIIADGPGDEAEAYDFINAMISPEAGVFMIEEYGYGSVNEASYPLANQELLIELGIENPDKILSLGEFVDEWDPTVREKSNIMFEEVKAGF